MWFNLSVGFSILPKSCIMGLVEQDHIGLVLDVLKGITLGFMWDVLGFQIMKKIAISTI